MFHSDPWKDYVVQNLSSNPFCDGFLFQDKTSRGGMEGKAARVRLDDWKRKKSSLV